MLVIAGLGSLKILFTLSPSLFSRTTIIKAYKKFIVFILLILRYYAKKSDDQQKFLPLIEESRYFGINFTKSKSYISI